MQKKNVTLKDIAKAANVTVTSVSLALQPEPTTRVSEETRAKIRAVAEKLNYRPNYIAKSLVTKKTHILGLIITTLHNPFYTEISESIIARAEDSGYCVFIYSLRGKNGNEQKAIDNLLMRGVDGLIICGAMRHSKPVYELARQKIPFVLVMRSVADGPNLPKVDFVGIDNEYGAYLAVKHLLSLGHRCIGLISGPEEVSTGYDRKAGYLTALQTCSIKPDKKIIRHGDFFRESGYSMGKSLLELSRRPSAIFAANDHMAIGLLEAMHEKGLSAPEDLAVVGFDDIEMAGLPGISLTTVSQKKVDMGRLAVERLIEKLESASNNISFRIILEPKLIIRRSCGSHLHKNAVGKEMGWRQMDA